MTKKEQNQNKFIKVVHKANKSFKKSMNFVCNNSN